MVRALTQGKTKTQADVITYFKREGCGAKTITDSQYYDIVASARSHYNSIQKALDKIGLDADEVREIPPVYFEGFRGENAYTKQTASGRWVSTTYEIAWLFLVIHRYMYIDEDLISMMIIQRKSQMNIFTRILQHLQQYQKKKLIEMEREFQPLHSE